LSEAESPNARVGRENFQKGENRECKNLEALKSSRKSTRKVEREKKAQIPSLRDRKVRKENREIAPTPGSD